MKYQLKNIFREDMMRNDDGPSAFETFRSFQGNRSVHPGSGVCSPMMQLQTVRDISIEVKS